MFCTCFFSASAVRMLEGGESDSANDVNVLDTAWRCGLETSSGAGSPGFNQEESALRGGVCTRARFLNDWGGVEEEGDDARFIVEEGRE